MQDLKKFLVEIRKFLEPKWIEAHESWADEPIPNSSSKYMCRYSSIFLKEVLNQYGYGSWDIILGRPLQELEGTPEGEFGYRNVKGNWYDHAWLVKDDALIDITADQHGGEEVLLGLKVDTRFKQNLTEDDAESASQLERLRKRVNPWLQDWQSLVQVK